MDFVKISTQIPVIISIKLGIGKNLVGWAHQMSEIRQQIYLKLKKTTGDDG